MAEIVAVDGNRTTILPSLLVTRYNKRDQHWADDGSRGERTENIVDSKNNIYKNRNRSEKKKPRRNNIYEDTFPFH